MMEAAREEETLRYGASLLAQSVIINDLAEPWDPSLSRITVASTDAGLAALAQLAALRLRADRCLVSLFDGKRQHIVAEAQQSTAIEAAGSADSGLLFSGTAVAQRHMACEHVLDLPAIQTEEGGLLPVSIVPDLTQDDRFSGRPYCGAGSPLRFYAGTPLRTAHGIDIGVCCVIDSEPRDGFDAPSQQFLRHLSRLVMSHLQARVSTEFSRRSDRMVRGLVSMVEGLGSMSTWRQIPNLASYEDHRDKSGVMREGSLNTRQQRIQAGYTVSPLQTPVRPVITPVQSSHLSKERPEVPEPVESLETLGSEMEGSEDPVRPTAVSPKVEEDSSTSALKAIFSRAANIIRESVEIEGALFLDAKVGSFGRLVPAVKTEQTAESASRSRSGSSGEESWASDETMDKPSICRVLAYATSDSSSINSDEASKEHLSVPDAFYERLGRRYPHGQIVNFDEEGSVVWAISDSDKSDKSDRSDTGAVLSSNSGGDDEDSALKKRNSQRPRKSDGAYLMRMFPGARSVVIVPLWDSHKSRRFAAGFAWTKSPARVFHRSELSYLKAFGSATMAEVARVEVLRESKAKEDVLGSLSHEIRSPLHGVILGVELLHDSVLTGFQVDILRTVETCGRTLLDTLDHLLDFSKVNNFLQKPRRRKAPGGIRGIGNDVVGIEAGMMSIFSEVRLDLLAEEVIESVYAGWSFQDTASEFPREKSDSSPYSDLPGTLRRLESVRRMDSTAESPSTYPKKTNVGVYLDIDPNVASWGFHVQSGALRRIVMNIFGNALKYTSRGHIFVSLSQEPFPSKKKSSRRTIVLTVSDSGRGISNDYLQNRLFTPFAQENQLSSGVGLGLSIVKQIAYGLGGRISVESQVDHGTTVQVLIPLRLSKSLLTSSATQQAEDDLLRLTERLDGSSIALLGFADGFKEHAAPLAVKTGDMQTSPRASLETMCRQLLGLKVVSEAEAISHPPSLLLCTEHVMGHIPVVNGRSIPAVVVCDTALSAHQHQMHPTTPSYTSSVPGFVSQPIGPRKLARLLVFALDSAQGAQAQQSGGLNVPAPPETPLHEEDAVTPQGITDPSAGENSGITHSSVSAHALPHRGAAPPLSVDTGVNDATAVIAPDATTAGPTPVAGPGDDRSKARSPNDFLLVDDNAINMKMLASYMTKLGHVFDCAANGLEALNFAKATNYRCIFMDISMPVMDGLESTRLIRAHERQQHLKPALIIALTGLASAQTQQEAYGSGVDLFLSKPVPFKEIGGILAARGI